MGRVFCGCRWLELTFELWNWNFFQSRRKKCSNQKPFESFANNLCWTTKPSNFKPARHPAQSTTGDTLQGFRILSTTSSGAAASQQSDDSRPKNSQVGVNAIGRLPRRPVDLKLSHRNNSSQCAFPRFEWNLIESIWYAGAAATAVLLCIVQKRFTSCSRRFQSNEYAISWLWNVHSLPFVFFFLPGASSFKAFFHIWRRNFIFFRMHRHNAPGQNWLKIVLHLRRERDEFFKRLCAVKFGFSGGDRHAGWSQKKKKQKSIATRQFVISKVALAKQLSITAKKHIPTAITSESYRFQPHFRLDIDSTVQVRQWSGHGERFTINLIGED